MKRAQAVGVATACREEGISRTVFYRWRRRRARPGPAPRVLPQVERRLLAVAIAEATWGAVAPSTVQRLLRRHGLATRQQRLLVLEH